MEVILLIVVLVVLIVVHELGHFFVAKWCGMRVDEFGIGYPPRALVLFQKNETLYTLNWLPFGGFVRIFGEDGELHATDGRAFGDKNRFLQSLVVLAGIVMNLLFAWILVTTSLIIGTPRALDPGEAALAKDAIVTISDVAPGSPAASAGLMEGDEITKVIEAGNTFTTTDPSAFAAYVAQDTAGTPITFDLERNGQEIVLSAIPKTGVLPSDPSRVALGVGLAVVGTAKVPASQALILGTEYTWEITKIIAAGLGHFFYSLITFQADLSQVTGPVGIAGAVGTASKSGLGSLISLMAVISINLALINLIPIPALDGGRFLFILIESVARRKIKPAVANAVNNVGFALLILLMIVVTVHDVFKLVT